jgi:hypothetical protein
MAVVLVAGTSSCGGTSLLRPDCDDAVPDTLATIAQSVPSATLVPCIATLPPGWTFQDLDVDQDGTTMVLDSDRGGSSALTVSLLESCDTSEADQIPSDEEGAERYERVRTVSPTYSGARYYLFPGGCVRYDFELESERVSGLLNEASLMLGFTTREELRQRVAERLDDEITDAP